MFVGPATSAPWGKTSWPFTLSDDYTGQVRLCPSPQPQPQGALPRGLPKQRQPQSSPRLAPLSPDKEEAPNHTIQVISQDLFKSPPKQDLKNPIIRVKKLKLRGRCRNLPRMLRGGSGGAW